MCHASISITSLPTTTNSTSPTPTRSSIASTSKCSLLPPINPKIHQATMSGPYQGLLMGSFNAPAKIWSRKPSPPRISIITNFWSGPLEMVHDNYSERLALSPEDRVHMFAAKNSQDELALSPVRGEDQKIRRRQGSRYKKQDDPLRVTRDSRVRKSGTTAPPSRTAKKLYPIAPPPATQTSPPPPIPLPAKKNEPASAQERATKLKARFHRRSERARRGRSLSSSSSSSSTSEIIEVPPSTGSKTATTVPPLQVKQKNDDEKWRETSTAKASKMEEQADQLREKARIARQALELMQDCGDSSEQLSSGGEDGAATRSKPKNQNQTAPAQPVRRSQRARHPVNYAE
ncbi:hypothetical protein MBM_08828 [Drepanopeziza brunnea f. sp. 'multigermtubi' MB_m1]|uniref:Uncharacterized protein n=1 Tax=Marssonina brunnea f. sp. multigermtubi (strain MB_m1) TaxID=1072389 RepID=K1WJN6_MARBU|nr:uncharacterized protein MBM_08828 [Drepanopeziza brunnea f. sp. 'multigermtubi' MB_m1]EKD13066.1 hypothetical protein MBM_08828 [Drepanopeziza brunnea f. sp. 'multigermtubi' MB_m1]